MKLNTQTKKRFGWLLAGLGVFCLAVVVISRPPSVPGAMSNLPERTDEAATATSSVPVLIDTAPFLSGSRSFWQDAAAPDACPDLPMRPILILPHYLPAAERIERVLAPWRYCRKGTPITRVIVVSPDHYRRLSEGAATLTGDGYSTPIGASSVDEEMRNALKAAGVGVQSDLFVREHGAGLLSVLAKQFFPEATYTPIVISRKATQAEVQRVSAVIKDALADGDTLVIVTADFSHYLSKDQADANDRKTSEAFDRRDRNFFWDATDDYTDFGRGVWLGMELAGSTSTFRVVDRMNSVEVGGSSVYTTSFFFGWWK